jgi:hypothetical protein
MLRTPTTTPSLRLRAALVLAAAFHLPAQADLLPPQAVEAAKRLADNPCAFDRTYEYCKGKKVADACTLPGNLFAGGGEGVCKNQLTRWASTIDLNCVRDGDAVIANDRLDVNACVGSVLIVECRESVYRASCLVLL